MKKTPNINRSIWTLIFNEYYKIMSVTPLVILIMSGLLGDVSHYIYNFLDGYHIGYPSNYIVAYVLIFVTMVVPCIIMWFIGIKPRFNIWNTSLAIPTSIMVTIIILPIIENTVLLIVIFPSLFFVSWFVIYNLRTKKSEQVELAHILDYPVDKS